MTDELKSKPTPLGQLVVQRKNEIQAQEAELKKMLPPSVPSDRFVRTVQNAITMNPDLAQADKNSVLTACMKAASDGLVLDGREAALTIYNTKVKKNGQETWVKMAQYIPMVAGIIKRVRNSGEVSKLNAHVRHSNDLFKRTLGLSPSLIHEPNDDDPGKAVGAYAVCEFKDGTIDYEYMSHKQIESIRERSKAKDSGPWKTDWEEMAKKTVIRRLSKRLPMDSDISRVIQRIDDDYDFKSGARGDAPLVDEDDVVIEQAEADKPAGKKQGGAAAKLNPKPAPKDEPHVEDVPLDAEPAQDLPPTDLDDGFEDVI